MTLLPMPFSNPSTYKNHSGVDFGQPNHKEILASGKGTVTFSGWLNEKAGYSVIVQYVNGPLVLYCHQLKNVARPAYGVKVVKGGYLGAVGSTGHSTGPHLHLEIMSGKGAHTYEGVWLYFDKNNWLGKPNNDEEEEMVIAILEIKGNSQAGKSLYNPTTGRAIRAISKDENTSFREAQSSGGVVYVSVSAAEYKTRGGF